MEIADSDLTLADVPLPTADWGRIGAFALTFDGYAYWGSFEACAEHASHSLKEWQEKQSLPISLTQLRTALFFEQRRWRHFGYDPDPKSMVYILALIEAIQQKVRQESNAKDKKEPKP